MAYSFNRSGYLAASGSAISLPAGDWTIGGWAHFDGNGTAAPLLLGQDSSDGAYYAIVYYEDDHPNRILNERIAVAIRDDAGLASRLDSAGWYIMRGGWRHVLVQRAADTIRLYVDGEADVQTATAHGAVSIATSNVFGRLGSLRLAEWAQWNRAVDADELAALALGWSPRFFPLQRMWYLPMLRELEELDGALSLSWNDVGIAVHPPILRPVSPEIGHTTVGPVESSSSAGPSSSSSSAEAPFSSSSSGCVNTPLGWMPPYRTVKGAVWQPGAVAGRACS